MNPSRLTTLPDVAARYPGPGDKPLFPESTLRDWASSNLRNFRARCLVLAGGKLFVDLDAFETWLEEGRGARRSRCPAQPRAAAAAGGAGEVTSEPGVLLPFAVVLARANRRGG
jgi:hypothetical protein